MQVNFSSKLGVVFGECEDLEGIDNPEELFIYNNKYYFFKLDLDSDGIRISDTCGRMIPIDREACIGLAHAIFAANQIIGVEKEAAKLILNKYNEVEKLLEHFSNE